jgi:hypothetical protein
MFANSNSQTEKYKFIVVYDKFTERIAQSLSNRAVDQNIISTTWNEDEYKQNKAALTNFNYLVILNKKIIKKNLDDPTLKQNEIVQGVLYKKQGHQIGIYIDKNSNVIKTADFLGQVYKENWSNVTMGFVAQGWMFLGLSLLAIILSTYEKKRAKFYLLMKAIDKFDKKFMLEFVQDKL